MATFDAGNLGWCFSCGPSRGLFRGFEESFLSRYFERAFSYPSGCFGVSVSLSEKMISGEPRPLKGEMVL